MAPENALAIPGAAQGPTATAHHTAASSEHPAAILLHKALDLAEPCVVDLVMEVVVGEPFGIRLMKHPVKEVLGGAKKSASDEDIVDEVATDPEVVDREHRHARGYCLDRRRRAHGHQRRGAGEPLAHRSALDDKV